MLPLLSPARLKDVWLVRFTTVALSVVASEGFSDAAGRGHPAGAADRGGDGHEGAMEPFQSVMNQPRTCASWST